MSKPEISIIITNVMSAIEQMTCTIEQCVIMSVSKDKRVEASDLGIQLYNHIAEAKRIMSQIVNLLD